MIIPVILAGGSGTRLWPMSREMFPKQLLRFTGEHTMLQQTILRVGRIENSAEPFLICNKEHRYPIAEQVRELDGFAEPDMILEPVGRNTAPAVVIAAMKALLMDPKAKILVLPADHLITDVDEFCRAVYTAELYADQGYLITFGVVPDSPETGYGYIRKGIRLDRGAGREKMAEAYGIDQFVEKPDLQTAEQYLASGLYCWNSGMFLFRAEDVYAELERFVPRIVSACRQAWQKGVSDDGAFCLDKDAFEMCPSDSIDYAVMEKTEKGAMVPFQAGWSDLGSWAAMWEAGEKDGDGNVINGRVIARGVKNSLVLSDRRLVAVLGMEDCVVVDTSDALLVAGRFLTQDVRSVVLALKEDDRREAFCHEAVYSQWGEETRVTEHETHIIRRLSLKPLKQMEFIAPAEWMVHWSVISGTGRIEQENSAFDAQKGKFLEILPQNRIKLENTGKEPLVIIEVRISV
ncbi:MAG: mannose-1-phosphate guanylyltransferase/mannose-6-phosphate isomerase [Desulfosalsimonas sp.]